MKLRKLSIWWMEEFKDEDAALDLIWTQTKKWRCISYRYLGKRRIEMWSSTESEGGLHKETKKGKGTVLLWNVMSCSWYHSSRTFFWQQFILLSLSSIDFDSTPIKKAPAKQCLIVPHRFVQFTLASRTWIHHDVSRKIDLRKTVPSSTRTY